MEGELLSARWLRRSSSALSFPPTASFSSTVDCNSVVMSTSHETHLENTLAELCATVHARLAAPDHAALRSVPAKWLRRLSAACDHIEVALAQASNAEPTRRLNWFVLQAAIDSARSVATENRTTVLRRTVGQLVGSLEGAVSRPGPAIPSAPGKQDSLTTAA